MSITDIRNVKEEIVVFLRNNLTDPATRGTTGSDVFTGDGTTTTFTLGHTNVTNVISVTDSGVSQTFGTHYTVDYKNTDPTASPTVTFTTAPGSTNEIIVNNHWGNTWIYPDYPRLDLGLQSYPRVSIDITSIRTDNLGIGGTSVISEYLLSMTAFADRTETVDGILNEARSGLITNMKNFYYLNFVKPTHIAAMGKEPGRKYGDKIQIRNQDFTVQFNVDQV
ncbi:MAG: hypothetical protein ACE5FT_05560 [Candidatus Nanoarchaeia archaeon]